MTDPRIIECAKALNLNAVQNWNQEEADHYWADASDAWRAECIDKARLCVLKWLEQAPSREMKSAIEDQCAVPEFPRDDEVWGTVYATMCAQAAKELSD